MRCSDLYLTICLVGNSFAFFSAFECKGHFESKINENVLSARFVIVAPRTDQRMIFFSYVLLTLQREEEKFDEIINTLPSDNFHYNFSHC